MKQNFSGEANRASASQEIPAFYGTRKFITAFKNLPPVPTLRRIKSVHEIPSRSFKLYFNITLPSTLRSSKWSFPIMSLIHATCLVHPFSLTWSPTQCLVKCTDPNPPRFVVFTTPLLGPKFRPQPMFLPQCGNKLRLRNTFNK